MLKFSSQSKMAINQGVPSLLTRKFLYRLLPREMILISYLERAARFFKKMEICLSFKMKFRINLHQLNPIKLEM